MTPAQPIAGARGWAPPPRRASEAEGLLRLRSCQIWWSPPPEGCQRAFPLGKREWAAKRREPAGQSAWETGGSERAPQWEQSERLQWRDGSQLQRAHHCAQPQRGDLLPRAGRTDRLLSGVWMKLDWSVGVADGLTERRRRRESVPGAQGTDSPADGKFLTMDPYCWARVCKVVGSVAVYPLKWMLFWKKNPSARVCPVVLILVPRWTGAAKQNLPAPVTAQGCYNNVFTIPHLLPYGHR